MFLLGDIFEFWFEYKHVVPKGFVRLQYKLASFTERAIPVYLLVGNHDYWVKDYFLHELNIQVLHNSATLHVHDKKLFVGHGDGLGGSKLYFLLKKYIYKSSVIHWIFRNLSPSLLFASSAYISKINRNHTVGLPYPPTRDFIFEFCKEVIEPCANHDYYIFGHLHFPYSKTISETSVYVNVGDWITHFSYGIFDGLTCRLAKFG